MKIFKNTVITLALCIIGNINTKQVGQKTTTTSMSTAPVRTPSKANSSQAQSQQPLLQPGTFRELFTEIRNMKTADVFTPNKSQFSDKVVQLAARGQILELEPLENESLIETLIILHVPGTIISLQDIYEKKNAKEILEPLMTNLEQRIDALVQQQRPDFIKKNENLSTLDQPRVTEENKQKMQNYIKIKTTWELGIFIKKDDLDNNDMEKICQNIDFLLRDATQNSQQFANTAEKEISYGKMAIDIAKKEITNELLDLKPKTMLKLANYILLTQKDKVILEIGTNLQRSAIAQSL